MQITKKELATVAAAAAPRLDMYSGIHKALRAFMADTLLAVGRMDPADETELAGVAVRVLRLLALCRDHLEHEDRFVHPAIEARAPGASELVAHEHQEHLGRLAQLAAQLEVLRAAPPAQREGEAQALYGALALFVADNFRHMHVEETAHNAVLWARYTDAELAALHDAIVGSIPPQEMLEIARWMLPSMHHGERMGLLADLRAKAPAAAFDAIVEAARPHLAAAEWNRLARGLGLAPAPELVAG